MAESEEWCEDSSENNRFKCCNNKKCSVVVCINCFSLFHKSCAIRKYPHIDGNKIICCDNNYISAKIEANKTETVLLNKLVHEMEDKNNILKQHNKLLIEKIVELENKILNLNNTSNLKNRNAGKKQVNEEKHMQEKNTPDNKGQDTISYSGIVKNTKQNQDNAENSESAKVVNNNVSDNGNIESMKRINTPENEQQWSSQHNRRKRRNYLLKTTASGNNNPSAALKKIQVVERISWIYLSNLHPQTTEADMLECLNDVEELQLYKCYKLRSKFENPRYCSFKVGVPQRLEKTFKSLDFWLPGTIVDTYHFRNNDNNETGQKENGSNVSENIGLRKVDEGSNQNFHLGTDQNLKK